MDDGGNNNGNLADEREASCPRSKKRLQLQRELQNIMLVMLNWKREEAVVLQTARDNGVYDRTNQRGIEVLKLLMELIGARATILFLFQTMKYNRSNYNREREDDDEEDEDEDEGDEEITTILEIYREITGTDTVVSMLKTFERREVATPTMNINTALLLAIKKYTEGILKLDGIYYLLKQKQEMIQHFQMMFTEAVRGNITYYANSNHPIETGIATIFTANTHTPLTMFQKACNGLGRNTASQMLEDTLQRSSRKIDTVRALLYAATKISNHGQGTVVHLDCSYFLLRQQPDVLVNLLSSSTSSSSSSSSLLSSGVTNDISSCKNSINADDDDYGRQQQSKKRKMTTG